MIDEQSDKIHEAADKFADAISQVAGEDSRVVVFYMYLSDDEWFSGGSGNMNMFERLGCAHHIATMCANPESHRDPNEKDSQ